ncbi:RnfH family protein [Legionella sp. PC997]|uniref:RnfH family protein n=1 Tax=Legionella sp. PC997 TaxID=2755562 RepID=UPI0015FBA028|nr:RnfH family protein [Legionella sp. PC997]QMT61370.1 RnfH family protein [Legionella sp. PC997]
MVKVELVYVAFDKTVQHRVLELKQGATVLDALNASGIYEDYPETQGMSVGIYAKQVSLEQVLQEGDRIEIYRPLVLDPKEKRRQKAIRAR